MNFDPHTAAELHRHRATEMHGKAERARLIAGLGRNTRSYTLWGYRLTLEMVQGKGSTDRDRMRVVTGATAVLGFE